VNAVAAIAAISAAHCGYGSPIAAPP